MARSETTKRAIADAFLSLLEEKSFDRVTITAIADRCGINRQTFYYHFRDIYDLIFWMIESQVESIANERDNKSPEGLMAAILTALYTNHDAVSRVIRSANAAFIYQFVREKMTDLVMHELDTWYCEVPLSESDRALLADFYAGGIIEVIITWILNGMVEEPDSYVSRLGTALSAASAKGTDSE